MRSIKIFVNKSNLIQLVEVSVIVVRGYGIDMVEVKTGGQDSDF